MKEKFLINTKLILIKWEKKRSEHVFSTTLNVKNKIK